MNNLTAAESSGLRVQMDGRDAAAVAQVLAGDREAFRLLVDAHARSVFAVAYRMTGNKEDADEVVQETFLRAYKSLKNFEQRSSFATWIYRIAVNRSLDLLEKRKTRVQVAIAEEPDMEEGGEVQVASEAPSPERQVLSGETRRKIAAAMQALTATERVAFTMRHLEGRSVDEICQALKVKNSAAKHAIFRAVKKLRTALEPLHA